MAASIDLATRITEKIDQGQLAPGTQLSEVALAEELGVSRNTLRESFRVLARDGLVDHIPHRGVFVHTFTKDDVNDLYEYRSFIETSAIRSAATQSSKKQHLITSCIKRMETAYMRGQRANERGDWREVGSANSAFHLAIVDLAGVKRLSEDAKKVLALARIGFLATYNSDSFHSPYVEMNQAVLINLKSGDFAEAEALLNKYFEHSRSDLLSHLPER